MITPRTSERTRPSTEPTDDSPLAGDGGSLGGAVRKAVLAAGVFAAAYLVARRLSPDGRAGSPAAPIEIDVPGVGASSERAEGADAGGEDGTAAGEGEATAGEDVPAGGEAEPTAGGDEDAGGGGEASDRAAGGDGAASSTDTPGAEAGSSESEADSPDVEPGQPEEVIEERADPDVETDPSEPGEMTVDEDLVEEVVDEEESSAGAESDEGGDDASSEDGDESG